MRRCLPYYSSKFEDKTQYNLPYWKPVSNISAFKLSFKLFNICQKPWRYQASEELESLPYHGFYAIYNGGGYVADLGYNTDVAISLIDDLENNGWIDHRTVAIFVEFTVFDPSSTLFSAVKCIYERYPTGGVKTTCAFETQMIYYPVNPSFRTVYLICHLLLAVLIFGIFVVEIRKIYFQGRKYFSQFWNLVEIAQVISAVAAITQYFFKAKYTSYFVQRVKRNPFETSSLDYIIQWCNLEMWLLSLVVFFSTIKMLRLTKFNNNLCHMTRTVKLAAKHLLSYSAVFTATLLAYTQLGTLLFGSNAESYSTMAKSLKMLLERLIGKNMFTSEMRAENDFLGKLYTFAYSFSMAMILINMFLSILNESFTEARLLKKGEYPEVELARFTWRYFLQKGQKIWQNVKGTFSKSSAHLSQVRRKPRYYHASHSSATDDPDSMLCSTYDINRGISRLRSEIPLLEECRCSCTEEINFERVVIDDLGDYNIDMIDEYSSLLNIKRVLLRTGTSSFIKQYNWSIDDDSEDDAEDISSLRSEWSLRSESDQSLFRSCKVDI